MTAAEPGPTWRRMDAGDIDGVVGVARVAFPHHFEDRACFAERQRLYPDGCFVLTRGPGVGQVLGYLIAYPWHLGSAPPLDSLIGALPSEADVLYLHDLALHPSAQGKGYTTAIVEHLAARARAAGWRTIALVAVNAAATFWTRMGFDVEADDAMADKLASYGAGAAYMLRRL